MHIRARSRPVDEIVAADAFRVLATMNPGGDYGKKELSPALRNRFTEVWVPPISSRADLLRIVADRCANDALRYVLLAVSTVSLVFCWFSGRVRDEVERQ